MEFLRVMFRLFKQVARHSWSVRCLRVGSEAADRTSWYTRAGLLRLLFGEAGRPGLARILEYI